MTMNNETLAEAATRASANFTNHGSGQQTISFYDTASIHPGSSAKASMAALLATLLEISPALAAWLGCGVLVMFPWLRGT